METIAPPLPQKNKLSTLFSRITDYFTKDARHYQITFLIIFLLFGISSLGWEVDVFKFMMTFGVCIATQLAFTLFTTKDYSSVKSALISSLSLCLMFKANDLWVIALAAFLSISSKFAFRIGRKHVFNPTNFGIIVTIVLTGKAWISPGQWGSDAMLLFIVGLLGLAVLLKVKRLDTALAFFGTFCALSFYRGIIYQNWPVDFFFHQFTSGTLLLFTFFMITDPVSTPSHKAARIVWAMLVGGLAFYLQFYKFVNGAPVWALFFLSPLTIVFDKLFKGELFSWKKPVTQII